MSQVFECLLTIYHDRRDLDFRKVRNDRVDELSLEVAINLCNCPAKITS